LNVPGFLTTAAQSNHSHGNPTLALTNISGTTASASDGLTISLSAGAGGGGGIAVNAGTQTQTSGTLVFANSNFISFGMSGSSQITASIGTDAFLDGIAANGSTVGAGNVVFLNANGVSFGFNGSTITASANIGTAASALGTLQSWVPELVLGQSTGNQQIGNAQPYILPMGMLAYATATRADILASMSISSSSNSSHAGVLSVYICVYTRNGSTLSSASSGSAAHQWTNTSNNSTASLTGVRRLSVPINCNVSPGDYWVAMMTRSSTSNANWFTASNIVVSNGMSVGFNGLIGEVSNNTKQLVPGLGTFSTTSAGLPGTIAFSQISGHGATGVSLVRMMPLIQFFNYTA
jgi:hypothetical protein